MCQTITLVHHHQASLPSSIIRRLPLSGLSRAATRLGISLAVSVDDITNATAPIAGFYLVALILTSAEASIDLILDD